MIYPEIILPIDHFNGCAKQIALAQRRMAIEFPRQIEPTRARWKEVLATEPPPASQFYPIRWKSERQRRAFFATNGFGHGIPYSRTHHLAQSWLVKVATTDTHGEILVGNSDDAATYVYGDETHEIVRQPMFDASLGGIPWNNPDSINYRFAQESVEVVEETWFIVSDPLSRLEVIR